MKELLGFAVLTSPLWLILLLLVFGIWLAFKVAKRLQHTGAKVAAGVGVVTLVLVLPFADEIVGRIYFNHLCATQAGVKVYQTVELPAEYWDEEGRPRFIRKERSLDFDKSIFENRYARNSVSQPQSIFFRLDRKSHQLKDTKTSLILGENVNFMYWGGWISRNLSPHVSAISCSRERVGYFTDVLNQVFQAASRK